MDADTNKTSIEAIEVDEDTGYETNHDAESETTTLSSSLQEWLIENGRRYHAYYGPDKNLMPTDELEQDRLDMHHEGMLLCMGGALYMAPVEDAQRVLDIGTGTGIWAIDYATDHPEAEVIGLDLSPIQSTWVPPNCRFEVDDFELPWTYRNESFDFIHARNIAHSVKDWPIVLSEVISHLKPGAWFEVCEVDCLVASDDNSIPDNWLPKQAFSLMIDSLTVLGRKSPDGEYLKSLLVEAGFVDVESKPFKQPMSSWPKQKDLKRAGALFDLQTDTVYNAYLMSPLTRVLGWTSEDADDFCQKAVMEHLDRKSGVHAYNRIHVCYGRKPLE